MSDELSTLRRVLEEVGAIVWEGDPHTFLFTYVSPAAERLLGYPAARWIEDPVFWVEHVHPDDREWVLAYCKQQTLLLEDHELDYRMRTADGRLVWLRDVVRVESMDGQPTRLTGVMVDITSLKEAEARAEQEASRCRTFEAQWRALVHGVPDTIALLDEQGRVEFANRPASVPALDAWRIAFAEVVATETPREIEVCVGPLGAAPQSFMIRIVPVRIADPGALEARHFLSIATDITERKHMEARLRQRHRLEAIGTLASGVAHEINNPVQGVLNYAELIAEHRTEPETVLEFAREITHESHRIAAIVRNLLAFSRQESGHGFELCGVAVLIADTLTLVNAALRKDRITVEVTIVDGIPPIRCRSQQIQQVILNLVTNAREALNERVRQFDDAPRITIRVGTQARADGTWVRISVEDQAGGIPEAVRARIFDPFFTTKGRDHSAGLGLAMSHGIVTDHGGELSFESELGVGSTFHLDLPVAMNQRSTIG